MSNNLIIKLIQDTLVNNHYFINFILLWLQSYLSYVFKSYFKTANVLNQSFVKVQWWFLQFQQWFSQASVLQHLTFARRLNQSLCPLLFFIFYLHPFSTSSFRQSADKQSEGGGGGGMKGSDKRGQSRHHSRLHPSHRSVSANDLMNTSPPDQPLTAHHMRRPVSRHACPLCIVSANLRLRQLAASSHCHILVEVISNSKC